MKGIDRYDRNYWSEMRRHKIGRRQNIIRKESHRKGRLGSKRGGENEGRDANIVRNWNEKGKSADKERRMRKGEEGLRVMNIMKEMMVMRKCQRKFGLLLEYSL